MSEPICRNCEARLAFGMHFCAHCGQSAAPVRTSTLEVVKDWSEHYVGSHGALWRTLATLFRYPGKLTREYIAGRRTMYLKPIQLYFLASILFFTASKFLSPGDITFSGDQKPIEISTEADDELRKFAPWLAKRIESRVNAINTMPRSELTTRINTFASKATPIGMLVLVPFFSLFLKLIWGWRARYADHFVFALHLQATIFFFLIVFYAGPKAFGAFHGIVAGAMLITIWRAFARNYGRSALTRFALLIPTFAVYFVALIAMIAAVILLGVALG